tara:strand:- start:82 stop:246 length:165 start_codon:yes stop_codon:yes gene_type:complete
MKRVPLDEIPEKDLNEWGYPDSSKWAFAGYFDNKRALKLMGVAGNKSFWRRVHK